MGQETRSDLLSVVVPTYREAPNLPHLIAGVEDVASRLDHGLELILVDDDSRDGTEEIVAELSKDWVRLVVRTGKRDLSLAVLEGIRRAEGDTFVVMDADLSHPPEKIPALLGALENGADFALGSRYTRGGSTADNWGFLRWLNSRAASLLAFPLVRVNDPMSGFFALRRSVFARAEELDPIGYKIGLELMVRCECQRIQEIPIHFANRRFGESKLTLRQQLLFLKQVRRLWMFKHTGLSSLAQFLVVGALGTAVNLGALTLLLGLAVPLRASLAGAIAISIVHNFLLNRRFSFSYARPGPILRQFAGFVSASAVGAVVNYGVALKMIDLFPAIAPQLASLTGIGAGTFFNFVLNRYFVFRRRHVRPD